MSYHNPYHRTPSVEETDEAFARRLYEQELGGFNTSATREQAINRNQIAPTALNGTQNPTVINARYTEVSNSRGNVIAVLIVNLPQILASIIVLSIHWWDKPVCDEAHEMKWKIWGSISAIRMALYSLIIVVMFGYKTYFDERPRQLIQITRYTLYTYYIHSSHYLTYLIHY